MVDLGYGKSMVSNTNSRFVIAFEKNKDVMAKTILKIIFKIHNKYKLCTIYIFCSLNK